MACARPSRSPTKRCGAIRSSSIRRSVQRVDRRRKINPTTGNVIVGSGNLYDGMVIPGSGWPGDACGHGVTRRPAEPHLQQPVPQLAELLRERQLLSSSRALGVAYQINDKTVIRAGIGRYLTRFGLCDNIFPGANSPFQPFVTVNNVSVDNPGAALSGAATAPLTVTTLARNIKPPSGVELERHGPARVLLEVGAGSRLHRASRPQSAGGFRHQPAAGRRAAGESRA